MQSYYVVDQLGIHITSYMPAVADELFKFQTQLIAMMIMEFIGYPEIIFAIITFLFFRHIHVSKTLPIDWPFVGMLPALLLHVPVIHDWATYFLSINSCSLVFKGAWFTNMTTIIITCDPADMRHIFSTNFANYPKGPEFQEFFDIIGGGIINVDAEEWKLQRKLAQQLVGHKRFQTYLVENTFRKVNTVLVPVLEHLVEKGIVVDLQDVFKRFSFDSSLSLLMGVDSGCLTTAFEIFPHVECFDDIEESIFYRHVLPVTFWKMQRYLGIGKEKQLEKAKQILDKFILQLISEKRRELNSQREDKNGENHQNLSNGEKKQEEKTVDLLTAYIQEDHGVEETAALKFLRDTMVTLMLAGRSTISASLTWFFWLVSKNPKVKAKILLELKSSAKQGEKVKYFHPEDLKSLVYLQGALCETLRLYPPVPFEHKKPVQADTLPSGHKVDNTTKILPLLYSIGRMEDVWGKDCLEFKPERWITADGGFRSVPSYKFMAFNSGPRTCLGKDIAFTQLRLVTATMLYNYHIEIMESPTKIPKKSVILYMEGGMKAKITRRL